MELWEKWTRKIHISPVCPWIPVVTKPFERIVYRRHIGSMPTDDGIACEITRATVDIAVITRGETALLSALRTQRRRRYELFLPTEYGRDLRVKLHVLIGNFKSCRALSACAGLDDFFVHTHHKGKENTLSVNFSVIALFAVDLLGPLGSVRRSHVFLAFVAFSFEKLSRIS